MTINIDGSGDFPKSWNGEGETETVNETDLSSFAGVQEKHQLKITLVSTKRKKVRKISMVIEGEFNIRSAAFVKENCERLLSHFDMVSVNLKNLVDIDLAAVQLLHVLTSSQDLSGKTISIDSELSKEDKLLFENAGLSGVFS